MIRGVLIQSCSTGAKKIHQLCILSSTIQWCYPKYWKLLCHFDSCLSMSIIIKIINFIESKIEFSKFCSYGTTIFNILDNTTELWMTKYIIGEFFSSGRATLYKNPSDQTVDKFFPHKNICIYAYNNHNLMFFQKLVLDFTKRRGAIGNIHNFQPKLARRILCSLSFSIFLADAFWVLTLFS